MLITEWHDAHKRYGWVIGRYVIMHDHVHFFCRPERDAKPLSEFMAFWKSYTAGEFTRSVGRGQRPRLQRCDNASFLITYCDRVKATRKSGITFGRTPFVPVW
jgi:REP element-mobilizing transposase RayT